MADAETQEFDFGKKKKDKEKKKDKSEKDKKEKKAATTALVEGEDGGVMVTTSFEKGETIAYTDLLDRLHDTIQSSNPALGSREKFIMKPPQIVKVGSKKVGWVNFKECCMRMNRPVEHMLAFVLTELGTEGSVSAEKDNHQLTLKGRWTAQHAEKMIRLYLKEYVVCEMCKNTDTLLVKDASTRLYTVQCQNCTASRTATQVKGGYAAVTRKQRRAKAMAS